MSNTFNPVAGQAPSSDTAAVATLAAPSNNKRWVLESVNYSYSGAPTAGSLIIAWADSGTSYSETHYIAAAGPGQLIWNTPKHFPAGAAVTITLAAGGSSKSGTVYPTAHTE